MQTLPIRIPLLALVAAHLLGVPATALAQDIARLMELPTEGRRLTVGDDHPGRIDEGDQRYDGKYVQAWAFDLRAGQQVTVDHISSDFDSYLMIVGPGLDQVLENDDGAGDLDSRIGFRAPETGRYLVVATTYGSDDTGAYTLRVTEGERLTGEAGRVQELMAIPVEDRLEVGEVRMGRLRAGMPTFEGKLAQAWTLDLMSGQEVTIDHISEDFDSYLYVTGPGIDGIISDDDGAGDLDSRISVTASETGRFRIVASTFGTDVEGAYTLHVRSGAVPDQWQVQEEALQTFLQELPTDGRVLRVPDEQIGRLDAGDREFEDRYMQAWALRLQAGQAVTIDHIAEAFDSYLYVVGPGLETALSNDDGAGDLDSRIAFTPSQSGQFKVIASALGSESQGAYTLRVRAGEIGMQWELEQEEVRTFLEGVSTGGRTLQVGREDYGTLDIGDLLSPDGKYVEGWALELRAGQEVTVDLRSEDFDCYLYVVGPGLEEMLTNDDGAGDLDSRIAFTAQASGRFTVVATSFGSDATGSYAIMVHDGLLDFDWGYEEPDEGALYAVLQDLPFDGRTITVGDVMDGYLSLDDAIDELDGQYAQAWALLTREGQEVTVDLLSEDFDAYLTIFVPGFDEPLTNDDGAGDLNSRISFVAEVAGEHRVIVSGLGGDDTGAFQLQVHEGLLPDAYGDEWYDEYGAEEIGFLQTLPTEGRHLQVDADPVWGELSSLDVPDAEGRYVQAWGLDLSGGQEVTIHLESEDFDAYLRVVGPGLDMLSDDDGGIGLNSRLTFTAPETGRFLVVAGPLGSEATGAYSLRVAAGSGADERRAMFEALTPAGTLAVGEERTAQLTSRDPEDVERGYVQVWTLPLEAGQRVAVDLISEDFDCYLLLFGPGLGDMLTNDDGAGDLDSRITFTAYEAGTYRVVATSFGAGATGVYTLRVAAR